MGLFSVFVVPFQICLDMLYQPKPCFCVCCNSSGRLFPNDSLSPPFPLQWDFKFARGTSRTRPTRKSQLTFASHRWVPPIPWCTWRWPHMPTEAFHRGVPFNPWPSFQKICLGHSPAVGTKKSCPEKLAFKAVNWWRCQHIVFIPKSWSLFWDHLRASKLFPCQENICAVELSFRFSPHAIKEMFRNLIWGGSGCKFSLSPSASWDMKFEGAVGLSQPF